MARLIDADALKKRCRMANNCDACERNPRACTYEAVYVRDVCDVIDEEPTVEPFSKWISVKERLPEDGLVGKLVYDADNGIRVCGKVVTITLSNGEKVFSTDGKLMDFILNCSGFNGAPIDSITHITHWMELPEPPEVEE